MKKLVFVMMAMLLASGAVFAESAKGVSQKRDMAITWNPLSLLGLTLAGSYGIALHEKVALIVPLGLTYVNAGVKTDTGSSSSYLFGIQSGLGARFYLSGAAFQDGLYIQPNASIGWLKFGSSGGSSLTLGANALFGYSWVWDSGFMMNLAGGAGYVYSSIGTDSNAGALKIDGILPALEFAIGYAW
ncbi:MAG: hypothetical protein JKY15_03885 [Deltaproteobacteria bacterium]|nr:hypothetical protein [Deltaproteobacteria bacterium]